MNLALLNPFRQADRIDSTLSVPRALHPPRPKEPEETPSAIIAVSVAADTNTSTTAPTPISEKKKKKKTAASTTINSATATATAAATGGGDGGFTIPKKQKTTIAGGAKHTTWDGGAATATAVVKGDDNDVIKPKESLDPAAKSLAAQQPTMDIDSSTTANTTATAHKTTTPTTTTNEDVAMKVNDRNEESTTADAIRGGGEVPTASSLAAADVITASSPKIAQPDNEASATTTTTTPKSSSSTKKKRKKKITSSSHSKQTHQHDPAAALSSDEEEQSINYIDNMNIADTINTTTTTMNMDIDEEEEEEDDDEETYWTACYTVSFNRRGTHLASGHASALVPIHDFMSRTLSALYNPPPGIQLLQKNSNNESELLTRFVYSDDKIGGGGGARGGGEGGNKEGAGSNSNNNKDKDNKDATTKGSSGSGKKKKKPGPKPRKKKDKEGGSKGSSKKSKLLSKESKTATTTGTALSSSPMVKISSSDDLQIIGKPLRGGGGEGGSVLTKTTDSTAPPAATVTTAPTKTTATTKEVIVKETAAAAAAAAAAEICTQQMQYINGVTSLSWDRRSRTLLAGAIGDKNLRLMDNTHPLVQTDCTDAVRKQYIADSGIKDAQLLLGEKSFEVKKDAVIAMSPPLLATLPSPPPPPSTAATTTTATTLESPRIAVRLETVSLGRARLLRSKVVGDESSSSSSSQSSSFSALVPSTTKGSLLQPISLEESQDPKYLDPKTLKSSTIMVPTRRHPTLLLELPQPLGGPIELHPRDSHSGLANMIDGSLALFYMPPMAFYETFPSSIVVGKNDTVPPRKEVASRLNNDDDKKWVANVLKEEEMNRVGNILYLVPPGSMEEDYFITCAAFGKDGEVIWAVTKCGYLLAFKVDQSAMALLRGENNGDTPSSATSTLASTMMKPSLCVKVPGGAAAWQIKLSRNWKHLLINSADCALRLYDVDELTEEFDKNPGGTSQDDNNSAMEENDEIAPTFVFQDNISKAPWASCDFSGDGEYVCGGCNSYPQPGDNYKLFLWNCITGELVDQLTGPVSSLYSLSCHPTRPFIAVGTSDGLIDVWGARLDWVAFAPDFQALQQNELYEEKEDEFDCVVDNEGRDGKGAKRSSASSQISPEDEDVDITTIDKVPAFDSDSEDEIEVFYFDTKVDKILSEKLPGPKKADHE